MKAEIIATGTEILLGETLNTSTHYLTGKLSALGIEVDYHTTVGDNLERLESVLRQALQRSDLVVTTGGLGPTADDLTKELVAKVLGFEMELDPASLEQIRQFFSNRGTDMPPTEEKQAYFPENARILPNSVGTAPGAIINKDDKTIVILPGPPLEMQPMFEQYVWPVLERMVGFNSSRMNVRVIKVFGLGESEVEKELGDLMQQKSPSMTLLAKRSEMHIRLVVRGADSQKAKEILDNTEKIIRSRLGARVFGIDDETMVGIVSRLLKDRKLTIATAESCTGGLLGAALTEQPGSSEFYLGGVVSYSNSLKIKLLGVKEETLARVGAVSPEVAREMAAGMRERAGAEIALAVTGIAGPGGGSKEKPVGLVYIGLATPNGVEAEKFQFHGSRSSIRQLSVQAALNLVRQYILKLERSIRI